MSDAFISHIKSHNQRILSQLARQHCYVFPNKPYTLAGLELGLSAPQEDAMTTAPRR
jgi:hypothetical protein